MEKITRSLNKLLIKNLINTYDGYVKVEGYFRLICLQKKWMYRGKRVDFGEVIYATEMVFDNDGTSRYVSLKMLITFMEIQSSRSEIYSWCLKARTRHDK